MIIAGQSMMLCEATDVASLDCDEIKEKGTNLCY